jgi:glycerophosphoryl diester phosphodiesterase
MKSLQFEKTPKPHLFAHRGGPQAGEYPENTMIAFENAVKLGYKFIETDVIATRDGEVICYHGAQNWYMKRKSGLQVRRKLQKLTYKEIKTSLGEDTAPRLEDVLNSFPAALFSIDAKTKEAVIPLVNSLKRLKAEDRVIITSFSLRRTLKANKLLRGNDPRASLCLSWFNAWSITPLNIIFLPFMRSLGIRYLQIAYHRITRRSVDLSHKNGISVYAWTVNDRESIRKMLSIGVDGVMSDKTELLLRISRK